MSRNMISKWQWDAIHHKIEAGTEREQRYQPKTGIACGCRRGIERDNCPACEGTGKQIDFAAIRARSEGVRI